MEIFDKIKPIIVDILAVEEKYIFPETTFTDLGADSLDRVELVMEIEKKMGISIPDDDLEKMESVQDVITYLEKNQK